MHPTPLAYKSYSNHSSSNSGYKSEPNSPCLLTQSDTLSSPKNDTDKYRLEKNRTKAPSYTNHNTYQNLLKDKHNFSSPILRHDALVSRHLPSTSETNHTSKYSDMKRSHMGLEPVHAATDVKPTRRAPRMSEPNWPQDPERDIKEFKRPVNEKTEVEEYSFLKRRPKEQSDAPKPADKGEEIKSRFLMRKSTMEPMEASWMKTSTQPKKQKKFSIRDFAKIKELGSGKYGKVFLVKEKVTNFICAVKIIEKNLLKEEEITEQFIRELKIQLFLSHPNIIKMYGYFDDALNIYILLELGMSGQLFKFLKKGQSMPEHKVAGYMRQIGKAVMQLHSNRIIHRDIKPENIVIHENVIKLCDFGWSVHQDHTLRTTFCGTPLYVCPQILRGKDYDEKIDIWSLGVMMYEMLIGENPFKITKEEELFKIVKDKIVYPSYVPLSEEAKDFLNNCLQKNPSERMGIRDLMHHSFFKKYPEKAQDKKMGF